jgi:hypothetical protein
VAEGSLRQRSIFDDASATALRLPLVPELAALHPRGCFPLTSDPRASDRCHVVGMMVLRPADSAWCLAESSFEDSVRSVGGWCYDVDGLGGSWPVSAGNAVDAYRLALQYGTVDAVMAGATTVLREGIARGNRRAHLWLPYTPLSWPQLQPFRASIEPAIAAQRVQWQRFGLLSPRSYPVQILVTRSGQSPFPATGVLDAAIFHARHPDGSPVEARILTSEAGADRIRAEARAKGRDAETLLLIVSPRGDPHDIDLAAVPAALRSKLDARVAQHDGGAVSLAAFVRAGAVRQLNLTLMRGRAVREVVEASSRIDEKKRREILGSWNGRPRYFPPEGGALPASWRACHAVEEVDGEAVAVTFRVE